MPVVGSCIAGVFAEVGSVSCEVSPVKGITGAGWCACECVIFIAPRVISSRNPVLRLTSCFYSMSWLGSLVDAPASSIGVVSRIGCY